MSFLDLVLVVVGVIGAAAILVVYWAVRAAIAQEAAAIVPALSRDLLRRAVERLPVEHRDRWREEWPAELEEVIDRRPLWALRETASLYWGAKRLAAELQPAPAVAGGGRFKRSGQELVSRARGFAQAVIAMDEQLRRQQQELLDGLDGASWFVQVLVFSASLGVLAVLIFGLVKMVGALPL